MRYVKVLLISLFLSTAGCSFPDLRDAATECDPATGKTPVETVVTTGTDIVKNPLDLNAWGDLIQNLVILTAAGFGYKEWRRFRKNGTVKSK